MTVFKSISRTFLLFLLVHSILGCNPTQQVMIPPTAMPTPSIIPSPVPSLSPPLETTPDTGWVVLQPGLERRLIHIDNDQSPWVEFSIYLPPGSKPIQAGCRLSRDAAVPSGLAKRNECLYHCERRLLPHRGREIYSQRTHHCQWTNIWKQL